MSIITDYADLFSTSADGVSTAMDDWLANRPTDPNLMPMWNLEFHRLGDAAAGLRSVAAHLYNLDAQVVLANVQGELSNIRQATFQVQADIGQIRKINNVLDLLTKFVTLGVSVAAFVAAPNLATAAALPGQIQGLITSIQTYRQVEAAAAGISAAAPPAPSAAARANVLAGAVAVHPAPASFY